MVLPSALPWLLSQAGRPPGVRGDYIGGLTFVARRPGLVAIVACDAQDPFLNGRESHWPASEVLHGARPFQILLDGLVHHQELKLPELRADVGQSPRADVR